MKSVCVRRWEHNPPSFLSHLECVSVRPSNHPKDPSWNSQNNCLPPVPTDWLEGKNQRNGSKQQLYKSTSASALKSFFFFLSCSSHLWNYARFDSHCCCSVLKIFFFAQDSVRLSVHSAIYLSIFPALDNSSKSATFTGQLVTCCVICPSRKGGDRHCWKLWLADGPEQTIPSEIT